MSDYILSCCSTADLTKEQFIRRNISPGGTADLLAMVYLLHFMKEDAK